MGVPAVADVPQLRTEGLKEQVLLPSLRRAEGALLRYSEAWRTGSATLGSSSKEKNTQGKQISKQQEEFSTVCPLRALDALLTEFVNSAHARCLNRTPTMNEHAMDSVVNRAKSEQEEGGLERDQYY